MSTASLQWVVSAYVLGYGGFVLLGGRVGDLVGRRRLFLVALTVFVAFSGLGGLAQEGWVLVVARFVTGLSAAFMTPVGLSIITTSFAEGRARNQALLFYAGFGAGGFSMGLVLGGLLAGADWRWVFFAPVVLGGAAHGGRGAGASRATRPRPRNEDFDLPGALLLTTGMLLRGLRRRPRAGRPGGRDAGGRSRGARRARDVRHRRAQGAVAARPARSAGRGPVRRANLGALLWAGSFVGFQFVAVLYLQGLRDWSPIETGLALLPAAIDAVLAPTVTPRIVARFGAVRTMVVGMALGAAGYALFVPVGLGSGYVASMLPTMVLIGLGFTLVYGPLTIVATEGVDDGEQGLASGLFNTAFQFGAAIGLAVVAAVVAAATEAGGDPQATLDGYRIGLLVPVAGALLALAITLPGLRARLAAT